MSIAVPLYGFGASGGTGVNFKIVGGTTQPTTARENTIWVNTDTAISGWAFSASAPAEPVEGMVWLQTGTYSNVEFNALRKNGIQVYPLAAKQYVDSAWVEKLRTAIRAAAGYRGGMAKFIVPVTCMKPSPADGQLRMGIEKPSPLVEQALYSAVIPAAKVT